MALCACFSASNTELFIHPGRILSDSGSDPVTASLEDGNYQAEVQANGSWDSEWRYLLSKVTLA